MTSPGPVRSGGDAPSAGAGGDARMEPLDYRSAGVDLSEADRVLDGIRPLVRSATRSEVLSDIGHFGGLFQLDLSRHARPVLVASTDGVGTKLRVAREAGRHEAPGYDLVSHCINDILVQGAEPLFFLDYFAMGRLEAEVATRVVAGIAEACREFGVALLGGETAEMPGFYPGGDYDVAGTIVGVVDRDRIVDGSEVRAGDVAVALPSSGLHTNGFSLARAIVFERLGLGVHDPFPGSVGTVADALLARHRCYLPAVAPLLEAGAVRGLSHITGGGLEGNLPRILPPGLAVRVDLDGWMLPPVFDALRRGGGVSDAEMLRVFNCGVGMVILTSAPDADRVLASDPDAWTLGEVVSRPEGAPAVRFTGAPGWNRGR